MESSKKYPNGLKFSVTMILIISLTLFPSNSGSPSNSNSISSSSNNNNNNNGLMQKKLVLGSRPPRCVNKCLNCRPCMAALVITPHHRDGHIHKETAPRDEGYYLLSWKCKCGNKFFEP
ncbi:EPIDERMAL PATTERNING FACTOR-like protein 6 isoform X2 [Arachis duranensis]|uniref:Epidermal patterning factor-like protein n=1 Tax=Arachis duranensis TaxID=130453 RepID=A0A9C6THX2_ARADU|nr:EPIDERMAL PATTERNING FACTOR-like protein 6 isoform X2 [Arachis duranensis]XP_057747436.1 EPIDERMAL PATTERNING FACTOR-like protein 6 [Arachis stenosperma]